MARQSGATKVYFASAAPAVRFPNVYGIDMPTRAELISNGRTAQQVAEEIGADGVIFQDLDDLKAVIQEMNPRIEGFDSSCFDGRYLTGDVDEAYLDRLSAGKKSSAIADMVPPSLVEHSVQISDMGSEDSE